MTYSAYLRKYVLHYSVLFLSLHIFVIQYYVILRYTVARVRA